MKTSIRGKIKERFFAALGFLGIVSSAKSHWMKWAAEVKREHGKGNLAAALEIANRCLNARKPEHSLGYLAFLGNIGLVYSESGQTDLAIKTKRHARELSQSLFPAGHPEIVDAQLGLAVTYLFAGDATRALPILIEAQRSTSADSFPKPELALRVMRTLGAAHDMLGDLTQAVPIVKQAYAMALSQPMSADELSLFQTELGLVLIKEGLSEDAVGLLESAYAARTRGCPDGSYGVASAAHNLGWVNETLRRWSSAQQFYEIALQWRGAHLGESHPATTRSREGLDRSRAKTDCPQ